MTFEDRLRAALPSHISIVRGIGVGGQGTVFLGTRHGDQVAVKVFCPETDMRRVDRECDLLSKVTCPHVVQLIEHFHINIEAESFRIVVYEYHADGDLTSLLHPESPPVPEDLLRKIGIEIGTGISTLWKMRIVHRDIKPANIVRASDGRYVLVDIGLARHLDRSNLTAAGGVPGTRGFRSPEQAMGRKALTKNSDVYSLGLTLYLLASRRLPFGNQDIIHPTPINLSLMTSSRPLSKGLVDLVGQMLAFSPGRRPADILTRFSELEGS